MTRLRIPALIAVLLAAACQAIVPASPTAELSPTPSSIATPTPAASLEPGASPTPLAPTGPTVEGRMMRIVDGDSVWVRFAGRDWRVRYIGIDAPELREAVPEPWAVDATEANRRLVEGREVLLEKDVSETDRFGRLLRYVWLPAGDAADDPAATGGPAATDGEAAPAWILVNLELVRFGYARAVSFPPDVKYQDRLLAAETEARESGSGLWGDSP